MRRTRAPFTFAKVIFKHENGHAIIANADARLQFVWALAGFPFSIASYIPVWITDLITTSQTQHTCLQVASYVHKDGKRVCNKHREHPRPHMLIYLPFMCKIYLTDYILPGYHNRQHHDGRYRAWVQVGVSATGSKGKQKNCVGKTDSYLCRPR